jgi:hypothetical protein
MVNFGYGYIGTGLGASAVFMGLITQACKVGFGANFFWESPVSALWIEIGADE